MATLKIYPGSTGMQQSLEQVDRLIEAQMKKAASEPGPRDALTMLAHEEVNQAQGRHLADLRTAKALMEAHGDGSFLAESLAAGRRHLQNQGARKVKSCGWRWTKITLRGGLKLKLESPYLRPSFEGRAGRKKKKRGKDGAGLYPLLWRLGFEEAVSPATRSAVARQSVLCASLEEAREQLSREGLHLHESSIARLSASAGKRGLELRDRSVGAALRAPLPTQGALQGKRVRVSLDGGRARTRNTQRGRGIRPGKNKRRPFTLAWKEPRLIAIDVLDENGEMDRSQRPIYETTLADADGVIELLVGTLRLIGIHLAKEVIFVADGADWIWRRIEEALTMAGVRPERLHLALDYYHATEYISESLAACKGLHASAREALQEELCRLLLEPNGPQLVIGRLRLMARGRRASTINSKLRYLHKHLGHMPYAQLRAQNLPVGSGVVESAIRRVLNLRFKSASMCWRPDHLEPLLYLRAMLKSGRWDQFFVALLQGRHWLEPGSAFRSESARRRRAA
jgi:hypothetical protein